MFWFRALFPFFECILEYFLDVEDFRYEMPNFFCSCLRRSQIRIYLALEARQKSVIIHRWETRSKLTQSRHTWWRAKATCFSWFRSKIDQTFSARASGARECCCFYRREAPTKPNHSQKRAFTVVYLEETRWWESKTACFLWFLIVNCLNFSARAFGARSISINLLLVEIHAKKETNPSGLFASL